MQLTSAQNPLLKSIRRAAVSGQLTEDGLIVAEGPKLLREALRSPWQIQQVFCTDAAIQKHGELLKSSRAEIVQIPARLLTSASTAESSQEIIFTLRPHQWSWPDLQAPDLKSISTLLVVLDGIQDPGNAGTIVRSAEAFGATGIVFLDGSTRVSNGKFLRASAGSIFRMPFLESMNPTELLTKSAAGHITVFSLDMRRSVSIENAELRHSCAIVIGSEGGGVRSELLESSQAISIPTRKVESLNAAVACSLALFEASRQRNRR